MKDYDGVCVSVVIPTYNRKETLKQTLDALFSQSYHKDKYEIIVIDDGSTDGTKEMIDKLINKSSCKIKYIYQSNKGPAVARNKGIKSSEGEIILFTDDDCIPERDWISKHVRWYEKDVVGVGGLLISKNETLLDKMDYYRYKDQYIDRKLVYNPTLLGTANCSYKREILEEAGGFDESFSFPGGEDGDLATRVLRIGKTVIDPNTIVYHLRENNLSMSKIKQWFRNGRGDLLYRKKHGVLKCYQLVVPIVTIGKTFFYVKNVFRDEKLNALPIGILYFIREVIADAGLLWERILSRKH
jgi:glycosyltransferase involved in cell wall biosynthesis